MQTRARSPCCALFVGRHTSTLHNQERVWKAEQASTAEKKKIEQLKREKLEERKIAELRELNDLAAGVVRQKRVDWLYEQVRFVCMYVYT